VALFPYLWTSPLGHLGDVFARMSHFPFRRTVLYLGQDLPPRALPWHYAPVWIAVTTPVAYLGLFLAGLVVIGRSCLAGPAIILGRRETRNRLLWILWCFAPLAAVIATKANLYDGWRHLFFVYPGLVMIAAEGGRGIVGALRRVRPAAPGSPASRAAGALCLLVVFGEPLAFMARHHPDENVFFNRLAGESMSAVKERFELDYWGLSYRRGLEHVLRHDGRETIRVLLKPGFGVISAGILPAPDRKRLAFVAEEGEADYFMGNYRGHRGDYPYRHEVYAVRVGDASLMSVFDLHPDRP